MSSGPERKKSFPSEVFGSSFERGQPEQTPFEFSQAFWDSLYGDPTFKENLKNLVEKKVEERLVKESETLLEGVKKKGFEQGYQEGMAAAAITNDAILGELGRISSQILEKRESILRQHEKLWCEAFYHLLIRFLTPRSGEIMQLIEGWMKDSLEVLGARGVLRLRIHPELYARLSPNQHSNGKWEWVADSSMGIGECSCEAMDGGGIFFSESEEFKRLEKMVTAFRSSIQC